MDLDNTIVAEEITANYKYVYDPTHEHHPSTGNWKRTPSGWSSNTSEGSSVTTVEDVNAAPSSKSESKSEEKPSEQIDSAPSSHKSEETTSPPHPKPAESDDSSDEQEEDAVPEENSDEDAESESDSEDVVEEEEQESNSEDEKIVLEEETEDEEQPAEDIEDTVEETVEEEAEDHDDAFASENSDEYLDESQFDDNIDLMNKFVEDFDSGEGEQNGITFKAVASNLDWGELDDVKLFSRYCQEKGLQDADKVLAFLYFQHQSDDVQFEKILDIMS